MSATELAWGMKAVGGIHDIPIGESNTAYFIHHALNGSPRRCFRGLIWGDITL